MQIYDYTRLFLVLILSIVACTGFTQSTYSVLNRPSPYLDPSEATNCSLGPDATYSEEYPWIVVSDRMRNVTYREPKLEADLMFVLDFRDGPFYVTEQDGDWVHLVKESSGLKSSGRGRNRYQVIGEDFGWIKTCNLLPWTQHLRFADRAVPIRVILIPHTLKNLRSTGQFNPVVVYAQAAGDETVPQADLGRSGFYLVYKIEGAGENQRYLLGTDRILGRERITARDIRQAIFGWVSATDCVVWPNRIALEYNYDPAALQERAGNEALRLVGYATEQAAFLHAKEGRLSGDNTSVIWYNDNSGPATPIKTDPSRLDGNIFRWPYLGMNESRTVIKSAAWQTILDDQVVDSVMVSTFFPIGISGASYPATKPVLFLSSEDLFQFTVALKQVIRSVEEKDEAALFAGYCSLVRVVTGTPVGRTCAFDATNSSESFQQLNFTLFRELVGLVNENEEQYVFESALSHEEWLSRLARHLEELITYLEETIIAPDYPYVYQSRYGDDYFWVPLDELVQFRSP